MGAPASPTLALSVPEPIFEPFGHFASSPSAALIFAAVHDFMMLRFMRPPSKPILYFWRGAGWTPVSSATVKPNFRLPDLGFFLVPPVTETEPRGSTVVAAKAVAVMANTAMNAASTMKRNLRKVSLLGD